MYMYKNIIMYMYMYKIELWLYEYMYIILFLQMYTISHVVEIFVHFTCTE